MSRQAACDPRQIEQFLDDRLSDVEQAAFEEHLESCFTCRQALEVQAAAPDLWRDTREYLSSADDNDGWLPECGSAAGPSGDVQTAEVEAVLRHLSPTDFPRMLGRLGGYEIAGVIGRGGMGVVLKGFDQALNRYVAIKVLAPHLAASGAARQRFAREAQAAAAVVHENVMAIHGVAEARGFPYLVMPFLRGASLEKRLREQGPLEVPEILRVGLQAAAGLAAAHAQGLVHRDIKPANILLEDGVERLKITDFGLARAADDATLTRSGVIAGTPQYMSPEQARGEVVDPRSDLFSLGSVLYALCTGHSPFRAETSYGVLRRICETQPRPIREINPAIPDWLVMLIERLHAKDPAGRWQAAEQVAELFSQCLAHVQQPAAAPLPVFLRRPKSGGPLPGGGSRRKLAVGAGVLILASIAIGLAIWQRQPEDDGAAGTAASATNRPSSASAGRMAPKRDNLRRTDTPPWRDAADARLSELKNDVDVLEDNADQDWESDPASEATMPSNQALETENRP